jgi:hypothetical protein
VNDTDQSCEPALETRTPSLTTALAASALVIALPGSCYLTWAAINETSAGFLLASAVLVLIALMPLGVGGLSARRHRNLYRALSASIVAGVLQLLFVALLFCFIPTI